MFKKPGPAISTLLNSLKFDNRFFFIISATSYGGLLLILDIINAALHEISAS
tara:strand:- start:184 stop:339 length:156 start_codon:yes stop_codon:yes gene_type:complete